MLKIGGRITYQKFLDFEKKKKKTVPTRSPSARVLIMQEGGIRSTR